MVIKWNLEPGQKNHKWTTGCSAGERAQKYKMRYNVPMAKQAEAGDAL